MSVRCGALVLLIFVTIPGRALARSEAPIVSFRGVVLAEGQPVAGASVRWLLVSPYRAGIAQEQARATTGSDGYYLLEVPRPTTERDPERGPRHVQVEAWAPGLAPSSVDFFLYASLDVHLVEPIHLDEGCKVRGRVVDGRGASPTPVAGARVVAARLDGDRVVETRSGRDGIFELAHLEAASYSIGVAAPGLSPSMRAEVTPRSGGLGGSRCAAEVGFELRRTDVRYRGVVEDIDGLPLAGARVSVGVLPPEPLPIDWLGILEAVTNERGEFDLHGSLGDAEALLRVEKPGFATREIRLRRNEDDLPLGEWGPHRVWLDSALEVWGEVTAPQGEAIKGALVELIPDRQVASGPASPVARDVTDELGLYDVAAPAAGPYLLRVSAGGYRLLERRVELESDAAEDVELDVWLVPEGWVDLAVELVDELGLPVSGAVVEVGWYREHAVTDCRTDGQGLCVLGGVDPAKPIHLKAEVGESAAALLVPSTVLEARQPFVELVLRPTPGRLVDLRGRVTDHYGQPVAWAPIVLGDPKRHSSTLRSLFSAADGSFSIDRLELGTYFLSIELDGLAREVFRFKAVAEAPELDVRLWPGAIVRGHLVGVGADLGAGQVSIKEVQPREKAKPGVITVPLRGYPGYFDRVSLASDGSFSFRGVPAGRFRIYAGGQGAWYEAWISVERDQPELYVQVPAVEVTEVERRKEPPPAGPLYSLNVRPVWFDGARVEYPEYELIDSETDRVVARHRGAEGPLEDLPPGRHTLRLTGTVARFEQPVEVPGPPVDLVLPPQGAIDLRVLDLELEYAQGWLDGVVAELTPIHTEVDATPVRVEGRLLVLGLTPGLWRADVEDDRGRVWSGEFEVRNRATGMAFLE